ncbi:Crp/Fnr family transcriptional regulator [Roseomonas elaeocarpi]|uniref:Crp/Fnr family transcriptional regulator n=1 Tax=Roseomonas elaeocarpi TaxID=907779 RepID=A0ABV6JWJ2_9PROT
MEGKPSPLVLKLAHGAALTPEDRALLEGVSRETHLIGPRQDLIREGARPEYVQLVLEGFACRYKVLPDGGRQIVALLLPGDLCDLHVTILGEMDHAIGTLTLCRVARLSRGMVADLVSVSPNITRALWWATLVDEAVLREWLAGMGRRPADRQLAHLFCELLLRLQAVELASADSYDFPLSQIDLADILGLTPVHVNRMLQHLRAEGLVTLHNKRLTIPDVPRLRSFAEFDPTYLHMRP